MSLLDAASLIFLDTILLIDCAAIVANGDSSFPNAVQRSCVRCHRNVIVGIVGAVLSRIV